jgi:Mg/Co/Ni transporter MgtE
MDAAKETSWMSRSVPVTVRRIELGSGEVEESCFVNCPMTSVPVSLARCHSCPRLVSGSLRQGSRISLHCVAPGAPNEWMVGDVMSTRVTCIDQDMEQSEVIESLKKNGLFKAPVVDSRGHLVSSVTLADDMVEGESIRSREVPFLASSSLDDAATWLERSGSSQVSVVNDRGQVIGTLSMEDVMKWIAELATEPFRTGVAHARRSSR